MESAKLLVISKVSKIDIKKELSWGNHYHLEQKSNSYDKLFPNKSLKKLKTKKYSSETFYNRFKKDLLPLTQRSSRKITKNNNVCNKNFLNRLTLSRSQYTKVLSAPNIHIPENKTKTPHKNKNKPTTTKNASYSSPRIEELAKPNRRNVLETWQHYGYLMEAPKIESIKELLCKEPNISIETAKHFFKQRDRKKNKKRRRMKQKKQKRLNFIKKQANITTEVIAKYFLIANADMSSHLMLLMSDIILNLLADLLSFKKPISRSSKNLLKKILIKFSDKAANWIALLYKLIDLSYSQNEDYSSHQSSESSDVSQKDESAYSFSDTYINDLESENEDYNNYTYVITSQGKIFQTLEKASQSYLQESILNRDVTQETNWSKTKILDKIQDKESSKQIENILLEWALLNPDDIDEKTQQKIVKMSQILTGIVDPESLEQSIRVWSLQEKSLSNLSNSPNIDIEILGTNKAEAKVLLNEITKDAKSIQTRQEMINDIEKNIPESIGHNPKEKQNYSLKISNLSNFQNVDIEIPGDNKSEMKGFFNELMNDSESGQTIQKIINHIEKCNQESLRNNSRQKQNYSFQISISSNGIEQLLEDLIHKTVNKEELSLDKKESIDSITQNIQEIMNDIHTTIEDIKKKIEKHYEKRIQDETIEGSKSSKASLVIKGHKPSSVVEHSNDAVCCLSLKIWAVWLLEITHNAHNWTVWISNLIYEIRQFAAILRGEVFLPNGQIKVLFRDDWNKFIAEMEDNTIAWMQYSRHVKDLTQSIVDKFHNKKVACCPKCLQDHLIKDVVRAHQTIRALTEALNCAGYWQRCLDEIVQQTSKLTYVTKKYNSEESVTGWSYSTSSNFSGDNLTNYNNTDRLTGAPIKEQRPCKCALKQLYPSEQENLFSKKC